MTAIEFENISKQYRLGLVSTRTLSHDLNRWWTMNILRKEDPYLKIGEVNDRGHKGKSEYVWALRDINFKVEQGDVVGIIGKNGAGKSTLLKILSKVTSPTTGTIKTRGRIGSLLEVGTGFHPEMTGRENIYMNGAILGMTKQEITRKLDEIIDFSGCERYIDTPVKRYSSGMMVRLGFSVAAHLEPEILVVDEVLAVGDAEFQKKAIGKMQDVSKGEGRTVLFVSHNMASIRALCNHGVVLKNGEIDFSGTADNAVDYYIASKQEDFSKNVIITTHRQGAILSKDLEFIEIGIDNDNEHLATDEPLKFNFKIKVNNPNVKKYSLSIMINNQEDSRVGTYVSPIFDVVLQGKEFINLSAILKYHQLAKGNYSVSFNIGIKDLSLGLRDYDLVWDVLHLQVEYQTFCGKEPISLWYKQWGNINFQYADIELE